MMFLCWNNYQLKNKLSSLNPSASHRKMCFPAQNSSHFAKSGSMGPPGTNPKSQTHNKNFTSCPHHRTHLFCLNSEDMAQGIGYSCSKVDKLLNIIEEELPYSVDDWEHVQ
jgi:hypothetical protein